MELFILMDAIRRASPHRITCVIPYYGYARQDRKNKPRVPISAALVAQLLEAAGADKVMAVDLHCGQIQGFFRIPVDNLPGQIVLAQGLLKKNITDLKNPVIVSPDAGGVERAYNFRKTLFMLEPSLKLEMAMLNKHREEANKIESMELVGTVKGMDAIVIDDMIDTAGTLVRASKVLKENGANRIICCATHGLLNDPATSIILDSPIEKVIITNSIKLNKEKLSSKIIQVSIFKVIGEAIRRIHNDESVSHIFEEK